MKQTKPVWTIPVYILTAWLLILPGCRESESREPAADSPDQQILKVKVAPVEIRDFEPMIQSTGSLRPHRHASLKALVGGEISQLPVDIGTSVFKGSLLFEIRPVDYQLALQQAEANLDQARVMLKDRERELRRMENLFAEGFATEQMRDQARTGTEQAEAAVKQARAARDTTRQMLADCRITAPYDGVITARFMELGEFVGVGDPVVEIMDLTVLNAEVEVPERYAGQILTGSTVRLNVNTYRDTYEGIVIAVNPKINPASRTFLVKVAVENTDLKLQAGLFCTLEFTLPVLHDQLAVPRAAVIRDEGRSIVWIIRDGKAHLTPVTEGAYLNGFVLVYNGLTESDVVVTDRFGGLQNGMDVIIENNDGTG
ncbi:efflux RND transporter periplasmic adaptor subunit [bacterium]|nr:efflux RND transporter periplasmic adaptor subunit [candidate division CSSED10-310 bacterium]